MQSYISTSTAALLTGEAPQRIREKIAGGVYETRKQRSDRGGGNGGESYQIAVSSLPQEAQIWLPTTPASARRASRSCWASSGPSGRAARSAR